MSSTASDGPSGSAAAATAHSSVTLADGSFAYALHETLGVGANAKVKVGVHKETGARVAVKIMKTGGIPAAKLAAILRESDIQHSVEHPNVVRCLGKHTQGDELLLALELVTGGELFDHLIKTGKQSEDAARKLFRQLISAVHCCHSMNICHRDIKPENLLLDADGNLKVADFGYAQWMHCISDGSAGWVETSCGSPHYASPEVIRGDRYVGKHADVWSCGVVLFALLTGGLPFDHEDTQRLLRKVVSGQYRIPDWVPADGADLIARMLTLDPERRITTAEIQQHRWFTNAAAATEVRTIGRFSCQTAEPEPEVVAMAVAPSLDTILTADPVLTPPPAAAAPVILDGVSDAVESQLVAMEQRQRIDTPASRAVIMGHPAAPPIPFAPPPPVLMRVGSGGSSSCSLDALAEVQMAAGDSFGSLMTLC